MSEVMLLPKNTPQLNSKTQGDLRSRLRGRIALCDTRVQCKCVCVCVCVCGVDIVWWGMQRRATPNDITDWHKNREIPTTTTHADLTGECATQLTGNQGHSWDDTAIIIILYSHPIIHPQHISSGYSWNYTTQPQTTGLCHPPGYRHYTYTIQHTLHSKVLHVYTYYTMYGTIQRENLV